MAGGAPAARSAQGGSAQNGQGTRPAGAGGPARETAPTARGTGGAAAFTLEVTDQTFMTEVMDRSQSVPVVIDFWAEWCDPCRQLSPVMESLAAEFGGRFLLAQIDIDANPQVAAAFRVQSLPAVFAVLRGQPLPLFQGAQPEAQVRAVLTELLRVATANGVTGRVDGAPVDEDGAGPVEEPLPPLHQAAYDAIERDDLDGAVAAYEQALRESPADIMAKVGLAQVQLMRRTRDVDPIGARAAAAAKPDDIDAQLLVADLDLLGGHVADAFHRLVELVRRTAGEDRNQARTRLVELFEVIGPDDPRVVKARGALASALF